MAALFVSFSSSGWLSVFGSQAVLWAKLCLPVYLGNRNIGTCVLTEIQGVNLREIGERKTCRKNVLLFVYKVISNQIWSSVFEA